MSFKLQELNKIMQRKTSKGMKIIGLILMIIAVLASLLTSVFMFGFSYSAAWSGESRGPSTGFFILLLFVSALIAFIGANLYDNWSLFNKNKKIPSSAKASLILSLLSMTLFAFIYIFPPILIFSMFIIISAPILGIIALTKIKEENLEGKGFALLGILVGFVWILLPLISTIVIVISSI